MFKPREILAFFIIVGLITAVFLCFALVTVLPIFDQTNYPTLVPTAFVPTGYVRVTALRAAVRDGPGDSFSPQEYWRDGFKVINLRSGDTLQVIAKWRHWYKVILPDGQHGWVKEADSIVLMGDNIPVAIDIPPSPTSTRVPTSEPPIIVVPRVSTPIPPGNSSGGCCKICTTGKACGDSCINKNYTCHQPHGCACNG